MRTVYRVEHHELRIGPYACKSQGYLKNNKVLKEILNSHDKDIVGHPGVLDEPEFDNDWSKLGHIFDWAEPREGDYRFGFCTQKQMHKWFDDKCMELLKAAGFVVRTYEVEELIEFTHQCIFMPMKERE